ncbi:MAG: hypothetical protein QXV81_02635 [Ignisphaera sp.]
MLPWDDEPVHDAGLWWRPMTWTSMKGAPRSVKPRVDNKQHQPTRNPKTPLPISGITSYSTMLFYLAYSSRRGVAL